MLEKIGEDNLTFVLTPPDGIFVKFATGGLSHREDLKVFVLDGGVETGTDAGNARESGDDPGAGELLEDVWYKPYQQTGVIKEAMHACLIWQVALVEQIQRDGTTPFCHFFP